MSEAASATSGTSSSESLDTTMGLGWVASKKLLIKQLMNRDKNLLMPALSLLSDSEAFETVIGSTR